MKQRSRLRHAFLWAVAYGTLAAQTKVDLGSQSRNVDFSTANFTKPFKSGTILPAACTVGETYFKTNAAAGQNLYGCIAADTWVVLSGSSASLPSVAGQAGRILSNNGSVTDWRAFGGDVSGAPDALAVGRLQGRTVSGATPTNGQALVWNATASQWEPGTVSGGGGATGAQLAANDYTPTRTSGTVLTLPAVPAYTFRVGTAACANAVNSSSITINNGTGTVWLGLGSDCTVKVRHNVVASCASGCTAISGASGFDPSDLPLYEWTVISGVLATSGTRRLTPYASIPLVAGGNITLTSSGGVTTISATGGSGITTGTTIPATCSEGEYYDHQSARARALFRCGANNHWFFASATSKDFIIDEDFKNGFTSGTVLQADDAGYWDKGAGTETWARGGTYPNLGTLALLTGAASGDQAIAGYRGLGSAGITMADLFHTFYFEVTFKLSRATDVKLLLGFQDPATGFLQYNGFTGLRYEAAGSAGVFKFIVQNAATTYASITTASSVTANTTYHTFRAYRLNNGTLYMSVDGEAPVTVSATNIPANTEAPYLALQSDTTSAATLTLDRAFLWLGTTR